MADVRNVKVIDFSGEQMQEAMDMALGLAAGDNVHLVPYSDIVNNHQATSKIIHALDTIYVPAASTIAPSSSGYTNTGRFELASLENGVLTLDFLFKYINNEFASETVV